MDRRDAQGWRGYRVRVKGPNAFASIPEDLQGVASFRTQYLHTTSGVDLRLSRLSGMQRPPICVTATRIPLRPLRPLREAPAAPRASVSHSEDGILYLVDQCAAHGDRNVAEQKQRQGSDVFGLDEPAP